MVAVPISARTTDITVRAGLDLHCSQNDEIMHPRFRIRGSSLFWTTLYTVLNLALKFLYKNFHLNILFCKTYRNRLAGIFLWQAVQRKKLMHCNRRSKVKVTAWCVQKFTKLSIISRGLLDFAQISYRLWSRNAWCTTNFQGQWVKGQGHSVT